MRQLIIFLPFLHINLVNVLHFPTCWYLICCELCHLQTLILFVFKCGLQVLSQFEVPYFAYQRPDHIAFALVSSILCSSLESIRSTELALQKRYLNQAKKIAKSTIQNVLKAHEGVPETPCKHH